MLYRKKARIGPRSCTQKELRRVGVAMSINGTSVILHCTSCGRGWMLLGGSGRNGRGYWKCPAGCNDPA